MTLSAAAATARIIAAPSGIEELPVLHVSLITMCKSVAINKKGRIIFFLLLVFFILSGLADMAAGDNTSSPVTVTTEKLVIT